jgi:hypothetical protein
MRALIITLAILFPLTAQAGSMPIATFEWSQPNTVTLPAPYIAELRMYDVQPTSAGWQETITAFPHASFAPQSIVDAFNAELYQAENGQFRFYNGGITAADVSNGGQCGWCQLHWLIGDGRQQFDTEIRESGWEAEMHVPRLGPHLIGYLVTGIERTVTADSQTITLHGIPIPEPASWLLVLLFVTLHISKRSAL